LVTAMPKISDVFGQTFGSSPDDGNNNNNDADDATVGGDNNNSGKTQEEIIEKLKEQYHFKTLKDTEEIWWYNDAKGIYLSNGEVIIKSILESEFGSDLTNKQVTEALGHVQRSTYFDRAGFNPSIEWMGCNNCMIDLRTGQTADFSDRFLNTTYIPVRYSDRYANGPIGDFFRLVERSVSDFSNSQCPRIMKFLHDIVEPDEVELILDFITYCLWREYRYANYLLLHGYGQNGKSVLLNLIERFLGKHNSSSESLERLLNRNFTTSSLYQKLANIDADVSGDILIKNTGVIKKLTGNDESPAEFKYKPLFKFPNYAKLIFSCNEIPKTDDETDAFYRRPIVINFTQQFLAERDNPHILDEICTDEEFSGLLHELLGRLPRIIEHGIRPTTNETIRETYERYVRGSDPIEYFEIKALKRTAGHLEPKERMYDSYCLFCRAKKMATETEQAFSRHLSDRGYLYKQFQKGGKRGYYWVEVEIVDWRALEDEEQQTLYDLTEEQRNELR
jgi:P4 family phage/plasmid primase-like protien